jgi:hypothetical protein
MLFVQLAGFSFMLPSDNIPSVSKQGAKKLHPTDATQNFGTFQGGPQAEIFLKVADFSDVKGHEGKSLGRGVITTVR